MRSRVPRPAGKILAAGLTAALLSLAMAGSAGAAGPKAGRFTPSGGTPIPTSTSCTGFGPAPLEGCAEAGYQASGRHFRYAQAVITVPDHQGVPTATPPAEADPRIYVALDDSTAGNPIYALVGIRPCTGGAPCSTTGTLPPSGTLVVQPSYLWNDGTNFHGMFGDAFGVWRFPF